MCQSMVDIQSVTAEIRRGKKTKKKNKETGQKISCLYLLCRVAIKILCVTELFINTFKVSIMMITLITLAY